MSQSDTNLRVAQTIRYNKTTPISEETRENIDKVKRLIEQVDVAVCGYNRTKINAALKEIFLKKKENNEESDWKDEAHIDKHRVDYFNFKDRIAVEVQFGEDSLVDIAKMQKFYLNEKKIDCAILILAMPVFADEIGAETDIAEHGYEIELIGDIDRSLGGEPEIPHNLRVPLYVFGIDTLKLHNKTFKDLIKALENYTAPPVLRTMPLRIPSIISSTPLPEVVTSTSLQVMWSHHFNKETYVPVDTLGEVDGVQRLIEQVDTAVCGLERDEINTALGKVFEKDRWRFEGHSGSHRVDYYGYRIAVEVQLGRNPIGDIAKMQSLYNRGKIDSAILVLPMPAFGRKIKAGTNVRSLLYVLPEFIGEINRSTDGRSNIPGIFTVPLFVFGVGIQSIEEPPIVLPDPVALPQQTSILPTVSQTPTEVLSGQVPLRAVPAPVVPSQHPPQWLQQQLSRRPILVGLAAALAGTTGVGLILHHLLSPGQSQMKGPSNAPTGCQEGTILCNNICVNTSSDNNNCGACGAACSSGMVCNSGTCVCSSGTPCGGACVNTDSDNNNCGTCGNICSTGMICNGGICVCSSSTPCNGVCVDTTSDPRNCGTCGNVCPSEMTCSGGTCVCSSGTPCNGTCVDTSSDNNNCGSCGTACSSGMVCSSGICVCPSGQTPCGSICMPSGNTCCETYSCAPGAPCCDGGCCPSGTTCCGTGCCLSGTTCCNGDCIQSGTPCCAPGIVPCGAGCCPSGTTCCNDGTCAPSGSSCCGNGTSCPSGYTCCSGGCCNPAQVCFLGHCV